MAARRASFELMPGTLCLFGACTLAVGQMSAGEFTNLGFDDVLTNHMGFYSTGASFGIVQGAGPVSEVLQGWRLFHGTNELASAYYNAFPMSTGCPIVYSKDALPLSWLGLPRPEGNYAFFYDGPCDGQDSLCLMQTGDVPASARVVQYRFSGGGFKVFANGQELPLLNGALLSMFGSSTLTAFDVSEHAGKTVELRLTSIDPPIGCGSHVLDSIEFVAAEPPSLAVRAAGSELAVTCVALDTEWLVEGARELGGSWERVTIVKKGSTGFTYPLSGPLRFFRLRLGWDPISPMVARSAGALPAQSVRPSQADTPVSR